MRSGYCRFWVGLIDIQQEDFAYALPIADLSLGGRLGEDEAGGTGADLWAISATDHGADGKGQIPRWAPAEADRNGDNIEIARRKTAGHGWALCGDAGTVGRVFSGECGGSG